MKQLIQSLSDGSIELIDAPVPSPRHGEVLIRHTCSLISPGTERMLLEFGQGNLLQKARQQPDRVKQTLNKVVTDGLMPTYKAVKTKLDSPIPLGYSSVGHVVDVGKNVEHLKPGDLVVSNSPHCEFSVAPKMLCAKVPDGVCQHEASFAVIGSICLHGVRLSKPTIGECYVVVGLGLLGQITLQILRANGCDVIGIDHNPQRLDLAKQLGATAVGQNAEEVSSFVSYITGGAGADAAIITAAASNNSPLLTAVDLSRSKGRLVLVGTAEVNLPRDILFKKELSLVVSRSYGPGRYDPNYEINGSDYPIDFVRWTENRNFAAFLGLIKKKKISVRPLISNQITCQELEAKYPKILEDKTTLGTIIDYSQNQRAMDKGIDATDKKITFSHLDGSATKQPSSACVSVVGCGNYTTSQLLPTLKKLNVNFRSICSPAGANSSYFGRKYGFESTVSDSDLLFEDTNKHNVFITTRHDSHATLAIKALTAGHNVFLEKPLAISFSQLDTIKKWLSDFQTETGTTPLLMLGFNRRFSVLVNKMKDAIQKENNPIFFEYNVNALPIEKDNWVHNPNVGGGRLIGEACHFVDLARFVVGKNIVNAQKTQLDDGTGDTFVLTIKFSDGSLASINYFANGNRALPKEKLTISSGGRIAEIDNFRALKTYGWEDKLKSQKLIRQDKGLTNCVNAFLSASMNGGPSPVPLSEIVEVAEVCLSLEFKGHYQL